MGAKREGMRFFLEGESTKNQAKQSSSYAGGIATKGPQISSLMAKEGRMEGGVRIMRRRKLVDCMPRGGPSGQKLVARTSAVGHIQLCPT